MGDAEIRTEGPRRRYGGTTALDGLDLITAVFLPLSVRRYRRPVR